MSGLVVMGASLGGLKAISHILSCIPEDFPAPIVIVQHRKAYESSRLSQLLKNQTSLEVCEPDDKQRIRVGMVYLAPADYHLLVNGCELSLSVEGPVSFARPSIDVLFESAAESSFDPVIGVLLTASSEDGAEGIAAINRAGGVTIVQHPEDAESDVAPRAAIVRSPVNHIVPLSDIPALLVALLSTTGSLAL
jgi:two-component system chemotaxis response regulator CheB